MRLRIFGRNSDDKGTQLEDLTRRLLERLGYKQVSLNVVGSGGSEIDIRAEYPVPGPVGAANLTVIGECKAYESPVSLPDWLKFLGKLYSEEARWPGQVRGLFVALSGANGNVRGAVDELRRHKNTVDLVDGENLIHLIQQEFGVPRLENVVAHLQNLTSDPVTEFLLDITSDAPSGSFSLQAGRLLCSWGAVLPRWYRPLSLKWCRSS
jgi:restriction endonuclease Mrr